MSSSSALTTRGTLHSKRGNLPFYRDSRAPLASCKSTRHRAGISRAEELMNARRFAKAVEELDAVDVRDDAALDARWRHVYGMALFRTRTRYLDAARVLHQSALLRGEHEIEDAFHSARALSRADQDARAIRSYRRFAQRYPRSKRTPEARFLAAWKANGTAAARKVRRARSMAPLGGLGARFSRVRNAPLRPGGPLPFSVQHTRHQLDGRGTWPLLARTLLPTGTEGD
ncbi:MAG: hypothetical protein JRG67_03330 [Deltaproteobacteria bacterium]|nr:hypothetical protein [Deltaproteobacteria bacterium]